MRKSLIITALILTIFAGFAHAAAPRNTIPVWPISPEGNMLKIDANGAIDNFVQDPFTDIINLSLHEHLGAAIILTVDTAIDDTVLTVQSGHGAVAGNLVCLKEGDEYYQGTVLSVTATTITLDTPLDYAFTAGAYCSATSASAKVDGSSVTKVFHAKPAAGSKWDITGITFIIEGSSAMDTGKFGDIAALTRGIVLRKKDGDYKNFFNVKTNGDFAAITPEVVFDPSAPAGVTAVRIHIDFKKVNGVVIRLDGTLASIEELELLIQDNLTTLGSFIILLHGHLVTD